MPAGVYIAICIRIYAVTHAAIRARIYIAVCVEIYISIYVEAHVATRAVICARGVSASKI